MSIAFGQHVGQLPVVEAEIEPATRYVEAVLAQASHNRASPNQSPVALSAIQPERITPGGEVAPVDGDPSAGPEPVVSLQPDPVGDDDIRFRGRRAGVVSRVLDPRTAGGIHLYGVTNTFDHPEVVEGGSTELGSGPQVVGADSPPRFPLLALLEICSLVSVHGERRIAVFYVADEPDQISTVCGNAVALHGDLGSPATELHVAAGKVVRPPRCLDHTALPLDVVDLENAAIGLAVESSRPRRQQEEGESDRDRPAALLHCPGNNMPSPLTLRGRSVTTLRKSGSDRKLFPSRCSLPRSKVKCRSVEIRLVALSYRRASVARRRPSGETTTTFPLACMEPSCHR